MLLAKRTIPRMKIKEFPGGGGHFSPNPILLGAYGVFTIAPSAFDLHPSSTNYPPVTQFWSYGLVSSL